MAKERVFARGARTGALIFVLFGVVPGAEAYAQDLSLAQAIKATYLYKVPAFVDWPPHAFTSDVKTFNICVGGDDPFGNILDQVVFSQLVKDRPVALRRMRVVTGPWDCHVLFAAGSAEQTIDAMLDAISGSPVLTVTDSGHAPAEAQRAPILRFVIVNNRVRFEINTRAAAENDLAVSSKLLSLAVEVR